jgi:hypothetical protein
MRAYRRVSRKRTEPRSVTLADIRRIHASARGHIAATVAEEIDAIPGEDALTELLRADRPVTRGDCAGGQRPCPWVSCRHHLYLDVERGGSMTLHFPHLEAWEIPQTCSLDVADAAVLRVRERDEGSVPRTDDHGAMSCGEVGRLMNLDRERVRQVEFIALRRLRRRGEGAGE